MAAMLVGKGYVPLFGANPFWRDLSHAQHLFVFRAILNHNNLSAGGNPDPASTGAR